MRVPRRIALFFAVLLSGGSQILPREILALAVLVIGIIFFGVLSRKVNSRKKIAYLWLSLVMIFAFLRLQPVDLGANITRAINFILGLVMLQMYWGSERDRLAIDLRAILYPMVYQAIATVAVAAIAPALYTMIEFGDMRFYTVLGVLNYRILIENYGLLVRPNGFFWEPGVFQFYLNILLFVLFIQKPKWRKIALTLLAIILTQSTTGIVIAVIQLAYFLFLPMFKRGTAHGKAVRLFLLATIFPVIFGVAQNNVMEKFSGALAGSNVARTYDLVSGLRIIAENPALGIGFSPLVYIDYSLRLNPNVEPLAETDRYGRFSTNGLAIIFYTIGLPLGLIYLIAIFFQKLLPNRIILAVILILTLGSEPLAFLPFFTMLAFSGLSSQSRRNVRSHSFLTLKPSVVVPLDKRSDQESQ